MPSFVYWTPPGSHEETILDFLDRLVVEWKGSHTLICLPHIVSFGMQLKSNHLIRQVIEIQSLELHSLWDFFFKLRIALFMGRREYIQIKGISVPFGFIEYTTAIPFISRSLNVNTWISRIFHIFLVEGIVLIQLLWESHELFIALLTSMSKKRIVPHNRGLFGCLHRHSAKLYACKSRCLFGLRVCRT